MTGAVVPQGLSIMYLDYYMDDLILMREMINIFRDSGILLMAFASISILGSRPRGTDYHIFLNLLYD
jgi:hypothetical protein